MISSRDERERRREELLAREDSVFYLEENANGKAMMCVTCRRYVAYVNWEWDAANKAAPIPEPSFCSLKATSYAASEPMSS
jgi:hypothetical protein